mgnify:CR=1 FL=1|tara:strand:+ start:55 stop:552 length:498 start_codon:yes stop_codon:yes gene_type:complete
MTTYGTVAGADAYHDARGNAAWASTPTDEKEAALLRASEYIDGHYRSMFQGYRTDGRAQDREWPRTDAYVWSQQTWQLLDANTVPDEIERATYEAAFRELTPGFLTPDVVPSSNKKSVRVEGAVSVEYWSDEQYPVIRKIDEILAPLIASDGYAKSPLSGKVTIA